MSNRVYKREVIIGEGFHALDTVIGYFIVSYLRADTEYWILQALSDMTGRSFSIKIEDDYGPDNWEFQPQSEVEIQELIANNDRDYIKGQALLYSALGLDSL